MPDSEVPFLLSQRRNRDPRKLLVISTSVETKSTKKKKKEEREQKTKEWFAKQSDTQQPQSVPSTSLDLGVSSGSETFGSSFSQQAILPKVF